MLIEEWVESYFRFGFAEVLDASVGVFMLLIDEFHHVDEFLDELSLFVLFFEVFGVVADVKLVERDTKEVEVFHAGGGAFSFCSADEVFVGIFDVCTCLLGVRIVEFLLKSFTESVYVFIIELVFVLDLVL